MPDPDQQPDFIVDPEGNNRDVRNQKYHPETGRPPVQVTRTTHSGSNPLGLIVFIISLIIFGGRLLISTSIDRSQPTQPAGSFFFDRGNSYYEQKRFEEAITQFTTAINLSPEFGQAYNNRGLAYYDLAKFDQALADFDKASQLMPGSTTPFCNRGAVYLALGRHAEAISSLNKALELNTRYGKAFYNRGLVYLDLANSNPENYTQAILDFDKAIEFTPEQSWSMVVEMSTQDASRGVPSITNYLDYVQTYANLPQAYAYRGFAALRQGNFDHALADFDKALELQPDLALAYYYRGTAYYTQGENEKAIADLEKVLMLNNDLQLQMEAELALNNLKARSEPLAPVQVADDLSGNAKIASAQIFSLAVNPRDPSIVFAGASDGIFRSTNNGEDWMLTINGLTNTDVRALEIDPLTPSTVYAGTSGGLFKSIDNGENWSFVDTNKQVIACASLALDPAQPTTIYAGTFGGGISKSVDNGLSWQVITNEISSAHAYALAIDPQQPLTIYAGIDSRGLYKSTDGGETWEPMGLEDTYIFDLTIDPVTPTTIYAGTLSGLFRSIDGGVNWELLTNGLPENSYIISLVIDPLDSRILYGGGNAVYTSIDGGDSWQSIGTEPIRNVRVLAINPIAPATLFVGTEQNGVQIIR